MSQYLSPSKFLGAIRTLGISMLIGAVAILGSPSQASAASTWNPTLLVNTESFQTIDAGDGTTDIELRFGASNTTVKFLFTKQVFQFSKGISVIGTISGSSLNVDRNATVGGTLTVTGAIISKGTISGANLIVSGASSFSGTALFKTNVGVRGILSGASLRVSGPGEVHGTLTASGAFRTDDNITINDDRTTGANAVLTFGNETANQTITFLHASQRFQFSKNISVLGTISGSVLNVDRDATVGGKLTVSGAILGISTITAKTVLSGNTLVVSNSAKVGGTLSASGTVALEGHLTGATIAGFGLLSCNGANQKVIYNSATNKFQCGTDNDTVTPAWSNTGSLQFGFDKRYVRKSGDTMTGNLVIRSISGAAAVNLNVIGGMSGYFLRVSGRADIHGPLAVTGAIRTDSNLTINDDQDSNLPVLNFGYNGQYHTLSFIAREVFQFSKGLSVLGTISGSALNVDRNATVGGTLTVSGATKLVGSLSASGTVALEGHLTGATIAGFGLKSCNTAGQTLQWNSSSNKFECGSAAIGNSSGGIIALQAEYPNAILFASGAAIIGQLSASGNIVAGVPENYYHWQTTRGTLQNYWISVRLRLPDNFGSWDPVKPIQFRYRTADGTASNNHVTVRMRDTSNNLVTLTGGADLANASFTTANVTGPEAAGTWAAKGYYTVYVKLAALTGGFAQAGQLTLNYETTTP